MKKRLWVIVGTIVMTCLFLTCAYIQYSSNKRSIYSDVHVLVNGNEIIDFWEDEENHLVYVFLPSYTEPGNTQLLIDERLDVKINNAKVENGESISSYELNKKNSLSINNSSPIDLYFLQSANTASMYLNTARGNMKGIDKDKSKKERVNIVLYSQDGILDYAGSFKDQIKGHGNHTWLAYEKKSYNLYMDKATSLLGMESGKKWVLLGNTRDDTHLRNKIIMDFARGTGSYDGFSPESAYVNLYANGDYLGLYLLCRSVDDNLETAFSKFDRDHFSIELLPASRIESGKDTVQFNESMAVEIGSPHILSKEDKSKIENYILSFDRFINDDNPSKEGLSDYIDIKTWAEKYLVDLIFNEYDASYASKFYWGNLDDMRLYAGPCWDYDLAIGYHSTYNSFVDEKKWRGAGDNDGIPWNYGLWRIPEFKDCVTELYKDKFRSRLRSLIDTEIEDKAAEIAAAMELERSRWPELYSSYNNYMDAVDSLITYMDQRIDFLDSYWVRGEPYCVVTLNDPYGLSLNCYVPKNTVSGNLLKPYQLSDEGETIWYYEDTLEPFDYKTIINEDITLVSKGYINQINKAEEIATDFKITVASLFAFIGMLVVFCFFDLKNRRR